MKPSDGLVFGIYPGGAAGGDSGLLTGPPDDPQKVNSCLTELEGSSLPLVVRCYDSFQDFDSPFRATACAPQSYAQYADENGRRLDLVLQFRSATGNVEGFLEFVREKIREHHARLYSVQICEEPNFADGPNVIDGPYPGVLEAVVGGVVAAKREVREVGAPYIKVGFNATPTFGPSAGFWSNLATVADARVATGAFDDAVDFVGLDFFPDVFRRAAADGEPGDIVASTRAVLETMREVWIPAASLSRNTAIHVTESGWPTGPARSPERQGEVLERVVRTIAAERERLRIERYTLFALRDVAEETAANCGNLFGFFGITRVDYSRKAGFDTFRDLIAEFGRSVVDGAAR